MSQVSPVPLPAPPLNGAADPETRARELNNRAALLHLEGKLDEARAEYEAALRIHPENSSAANNLGYVLAQQGHLDEAIETYRQALKIDPAKSTTFVNLGVAQMALGQGAAAVASLERAVEL